MESLESMESLNRWNRFAIPSDSHSRAGLAGLGPVLGRGLGHQAARHHGAAEEVEALARGDGHADGVRRKARGHSGVGERQVRLGQHVDPLVRSEATQQLLPNLQLHHQR
jgi:hypothetical protein